MLEELNGKSVLITGASTGIGAAVARGFGRCGAKVGCTTTAAGRRPSRSPRQCAVRAARPRSSRATSRTRAIWHVSSRRTSDFCPARRADQQRRRRGEAEPVRGAGDQLIDDIIALNARSVVTACRLAVPHFLRQGHGNVINTTSLAARQSGGPGSSIYTAAKGFVQA